MSRATFQVYLDEIEDWRWRLLHDNGNIIADSGQGYSSKQAAVRGIESVKRNASEAEIEEVPDPS